MRQHSMDGEHKLVLLENQLFQNPIDNLPVMPFVTKVKSMDSIITNGSIFFKQWCPNVTELILSFGDFASIMLGNGDVMSGVKVLTFHFRNSFNEFGDFLEEMHENFPSLEKFKLILDTMDCDSDCEPTWDVDAPYQPLYFIICRS